MFFQLILTKFEKWTVYVFTESWSRDHSHASFTEEQCASHTGLVHTCSSIFENKDFFLRFRKNTRPHPNVAYSIRFRLSTWKRFNNGPHRACAIWYVTSSHSKTSKTSVFVRSLENDNLCLGLDGRPNRRKTLVFKSFYFTALRDLYTRTKVLFFATCVTLIWVSANCQIF